MNTLKSELEEIELFRCGVEEKQEEDRGLLDKLK